MNNHEAVPYFPDESEDAILTCQIPYLVFVSSTATLLSYRPDKIVTVFYVLYYDIDGGIDRVLIHLISESTSELV